MSETTHLICAHCGGDVSLSNATNVPVTGVLTSYDSQVAFNCPKCGIKYPLPVLRLDKLPS